MRRFVHPVKLFFFSLHSALSALFCEGANYSNRVAILSNIICDNIGPLMHFLGNREGNWNREFLRLFGSGPGEAASAMRRLLAIQPAESTKLL